MKKRFFALALAALSVFSLMASASAANSSYSGISFTNGVTRRFLFSDSPEIITKSNSTNGYLAGTTFKAGERMDFELYHHNNTGMTKRFGIVVQNGNSTAATLTLHNKAIGTASGASQQSEQLMTAPMVMNYLQSSSSTVTVPANSSVFVLYKDVPNGNMVDGKLSMTSNKGNVYARIVYGNTTTAASTYFNIAKEEAAQSSYFSGQLNYVQKNATVDANKVSAFVLGEWPADRNFKNSNEYTTVLSHKSGSLDKLAGNFGVVYQIKLQNLNGRKVILTPDWGNTMRKSVDIVFKDSTGWHTTGTKTSGTQNMALVNDTLSIVIPGGNCADLKFVIK